MTRLEDELAVLIWDGLPTLAGVPTSLTDFHVTTPSGAFVAPQRGQRIPDPSRAGTDAEHAIMSR